MTVWTIAESKKPKASGQRTSQSMKIEICTACRTALTTSISLAPHQTLDRFVQLADLLAAATRPDRLCHAVLRVIGQQLESDALESRPGRVDLGEHVDAVPIFRDHLLDAPHLPLDTAQPRLDLLPVLGIASHDPNIPPRGIVTDSPRGGQAGRGLPRWLCCSNISRISRTLVASSGFLSAVRIETMRGKRSANPGPSAVMPAVWRGLGVIASARTSTTRAGSSQTSGTRFELPRAGLSPTSRLDSRP